MPVGGGRDLLGRFVVRPGQGQGRDVKTIPVERRDEAAVQFPDGVVAQVFRDEADAQTPFRLPGHAPGGMGRGEVQRRAGLGIKPRQFRLQCSVIIALVWQVESRQAHLAQWIGDLRLFLQQHIDSLLEGRARLVDVGLTVIDRRQESRLVDFEAVAVLQCQGPGEEGAGGLNEARLLADHTEIAKRFEKVRVVVGRRPKVPDGGVDISARFQRGP